MLGRMPRSPGRSATRARGALAARASAALLAALASAILLAGCALTPVTFPTANPDSPLVLTGWRTRPAGAPPFPAVVLMHGCHGVAASTVDWARWLTARGYVALVVDSWTARGMTEGCTPFARDSPPNERFGDAAGALHFLHGQPDVDRNRIGVMGWSNGGVFAMSVVNGPSLERQRMRGVVLQSPGYRAAVAIYPGGCFSLIHEDIIRPLLVLVGAADDWTLASVCDDMVQTLRRHGDPAEIVIYPGAVHYFDVVGQSRTYLPDVANRNRAGDCCGATVGYDANAAADAHRRVADFLSRHVAAPSP